MRVQRVSFSPNSTRVIVLRKKLGILVKSQGMANVSTAKKMGIAARVAAQQAGRSRTFQAVTRGVRATAAHFAHVLHQLWMEVTGFTFLAFAAIGGIAFVREYAKYSAGKSTSGHVVITAIFTLMFGWFGLSSFWRVRKKKAGR